MLNGVSRFLSPAVMKNRGARLPSEVGKRSFLKSRWAQPCKYLSNFVTASHGHASLCTFGQNAKKITPPPTIITSHYTILRM